MTRTTAYAIAITQVALACINGIYLVIGHATFLNVVGLFGCAFVAQLYLSGIRRGRFQ